MEGNLASGRLNGAGKIKVANRAVIEGEFINGEVVIQAKMFLPDGAVHEGEMKSYYTYGNWYELHGKGTIKKADGTFVEGSFNNGLLHGHAKVTTADGAYVEGTFELGRFCGWCKFVFKDGVSIEGRRVDKDWVGPVKTTFARFTAEGSYLGEKEHGVWTYNFKNGMNITGTYDNGVERGHWSITLPSGKTIEKDF
eukprot:gene8443-10023_t